MKKKITAVALVVSLLAMLIAGGTYAYLKDTDTATNVFTIGDVEIKLFEDMTDGVQDETEGWNLTGEDFLPSVTFEKDAWVKNTGSEDAYVRVFVLYPKDIAPMLDVKYVFDYDTANTDWADAKDENGNLITDLLYTIDGVEYTGRCLVYVANNGILEPDTSTSDTVSSVKLLSNVQCRNNGSSTTYILNTADGLYTYTSATADFPVVVIAQAGQTINGETSDWDANTALNVMFGSPASVNPYNSVITSEFMQLVAEGDIVIEEGAIASIADDITELVVDGASVKAIGDWAGSGATSLETLIVTEGVEALGYRTFKSNPTLKTVVLPSSMTDLGSGAFQGCEALESVTLPETLTVLAENTFYVSSLAEIDLPETLVSIETSALRGTNLKTVTIPASVTHIGTFAFRECGNLETVYILGENVTFDGSMVFSNKQTGESNGITIYVKNQAMEAAAKAATKSSTNVTVVIDPTIGA